MDFFRCSSSFGTQPRNVSSFQDSLIAQPSSSREWQSIWCNEASRIRLKVRTVTMQAIQRPNHALFVYPQLFLSNTHARSYDVIHNDLRLILNSNAPPPWSKRDRRRRINWHSPTPLARKILLLKLLGSFRDRDQTPPERN